MIILNLIVSGNEEAKAITRYLLQTKYAVQVILYRPSTLIELDVSSAEVCTDINNMLFATKSVLFNEIDENLKKEFPQANFYMYAAPAIHISTPFYERIKSTVPGDLSLNLQKENRNLLPK